MKFGNVSTGLPMLLLPMLLMACAGNTMYVDVKTVADMRSVVPVDGMTSSGQPDAVALEVFSASGYEAVIDLRGPGEKRGIDEAAIVAELGMRYANLPVVGRDAINFENAAKLRQLIGTFDGPVLIHCRSGNRVAALLALSKSAAGADAETALEHGRQAGLTKLTGLVRERLRERE